MKKPYKGKLPVQVIASLKHNINNQLSIVSGNLLKIKDVKTASSILNSILTIVDYLDEIESREIWPDYNSEDFK